MTFYGMVFEIWTHTVGLTQLYAFLYKRSIKNILSSVEESTIPQDGVISLKCVIVLDETLPVGLLANTAAALGLSLGNHIPGLIGPDVIDAEGAVHKGITAIPIPILAVDGVTLRSLYRSAMDESQELLTIGFSKTAQQCNSYKVYSKEMQQKSGADLDFLGVCIYGSAKIVNRICGQIKLLR